MDGAGGCQGAEREAWGSAEPVGQLPKRRGEVSPRPTRGGGQSPGSWGCPRSSPCDGTGAALGIRRGGRGFAAAPSGTVPTPAVGCSLMLEQNAIGPSQRPPPPHTTPARGGTGWDKMCPVLTKDAVFLQGAVDLAVGVDLEVVLGGTVELPAPGRSPEVLVDAAASPCIPARPRVTRGGSGGLGYPRGPAREPRLLQQTQQQDPNYNHCGMMAAALNLLGRWRLGANDTRGPIKAVLLAALQSCRAHTGSSCEALASFYQPRSGPFICLRFT